MEELLDFTEFAYHEGAAFIPWILLGVSVYLIVKLYPYFIQFVEERTKANHAHLKLEAERGEIIRNNTAAINNNTAALEGVLKDRELIVSKVDELAQDGQMYDMRIEAKIENSNRDLLKVSKDVEILKDRVQ